MNVIIMLTNLKQMTLTFPPKELEFDYAIANFFFYLGEFSDPSFGSYRKHWSKNWRKTW